MDENIKFNDQWSQYTDSYIRKSPDVLFIGIYSSVTHDAIAASGCEDIQAPSVIHDASAPNVLNNSENLIIQIIPAQVRALINHIRTPDNVLTQVNIADLHFLCLRQGTGCMVGMSNFNVGNQRQSVSKLDQTLFTLTHKHFTRQQSLGGVHVLKIAAMLRGDVIVIGISFSGTYPILRILKDLIKSKNNREIVKTPGTGLLDVGNKGFNTVELTT